MSKYLSFLHYAQSPSGHFHNFMSYDQVWLDDQGSEDCLGRVLWGCGYTLRAELHPNVKKVAREIFDAAQRWIPLTHCLRARAYMGMGCYHYLEHVPDHKEISAAFKKIADSICRDFRANAKPDWAWFEDFMSYSNGMIPRALFMAYQMFGDEEYRKVAVESIEFLTSICIIDGKLYPVGCNGWLIKDSERAWYDQQPVDPMGHTLSYISAYDATGDRKYLELAKISFDWFFGKNSVGEALYDPVTGGCYDALGPDGPNLNQGSESTIACLLAQLAMQPYLDKL
ncbi:MAG: glycosyltransferase [Armatimonadetes bacterium]|nr:glycosyltransferase [Armatimonadota bacterium]